MKRIFIYTLLLFFIFAKPTYAYIDPASGSYLFQILTAGAIGGIFFFKDIFKKVRGIVRPSKKEVPSEDE